MFRINSSLRSGTEDGLAVGPLFNKTLQARIISLSARRVRTHCNKDISPSTRRLSYWSCAPPELLFRLIGEYRRNATTIGRYPLCAGLSKQAETLS